MTRLQSNERPLRRTAWVVELVILALVAVALVFPVPASADEAGFERIDDAIEAGVLDPDVVTERDENGRLEGFVMFPDDAAEQGGFAEEKQELLDRLEREVEVLYDYEPLPLLFVRFADEQAVLTALNEPSITAVGANRTYERSLVQSLPLVRQPQAQALGHTGAGTTIAVIDGGIDSTNPAFGTCAMVGDPGCKIAKSISFAPDDACDQESPTPQQAPKNDDCGGLPILEEADPDPHGTNVAAIALGVAPDARVIALDVFSGGSASTETIYKAIRWVIMNAPFWDIRAMNLSLGVANTFNTAPCSAANPYQTLFGQARARGVLPVVASGNFAFSNGAYRDGIAWPACTPNAVSVGAVYDANLGTQTWPGLGCTDITTAADQVVCFSQSGSPLTMLAPGSSIEAAGIDMSGTSQAAPHVAGAAAVLASAAPGAPAWQVEEALKLGRPILDPRNLLVRPRLDVELALSFFRCDGVPVTLRGTNGSETIVGTNGPDVIAALGGDDVISSLGADDRVCAGAGNDVVDGGDGSDRLLGEADHDTLKDGDSSCVPGSFTLCAYPSVWADVLVGGPGLDKADYSSRAVSVALSLDGAANDGESGEADLIGGDVEGAIGGAGDDSIVGNNEPNTLRSGAGDDVVDGRGGPDSLDCGAGWDWFNPDSQDQSVVDCEIHFRRAR